MLQLTTRTRSQECNHNIRQTFGMCTQVQIFATLTSCGNNTTSIPAASGTIHNYLHVMEMWLYHLFKNIPNMKQKKWTFLRKFLKQMFTNKHKYDKWIVHITVLLEPCRVQHTSFGLNGILQYKEVEMPIYQTLHFLTSQSRADTTDALT